jgi:hypothetical protein
LYKNKQTSSSWRNKLDILQSERELQEWIDKYNFGTVPSSVRSYQTRCSISNSKKYKLIKKLKKEGGKYPYYLGFHQGVPLDIPDGDKGFITVFGYLKESTTFSCYEVTNPEVAKRDKDSPSNLKKTLLRINSLPGFETSILPEEIDGQAIIYWHPYEGDLCGTCADSDELWFPILFLPNEWKIQCENCGRKLGPA